MATKIRKNASETVESVDEWDDDGVIWVSREEGLAILDRQARKYLGMSGEEFVRKYRAGEIDEDCSDVSRVAMLIPFADE
jgi:hypothetical protein